MTFENIEVNLILKTYKILNLKLQKMGNIFDRHLQSFFLLSLRICRQCMQDLVYRTYGQCVRKSWFQHFLLFHWWFFFFQIVKSKDFLKLNCSFFFFFYFSDFFFQWITSSMFLAKQSGFCSLISVPQVNNTIIPKAAEVGNQIMVSKWCAFHFCSDPGFFAKTPTFGTSQSLPVG